MINKRLKIILLIVLGILLVPLIAKQFTSEVNWGIEDFALMAVLLFGTGLLIEVVLRYVQSKGNRILLCSLIIIALFLVWAELAVGIFGSPFAGS
ncbi:MAG: hypothetical protein IPH96_03110 [Saprospiraceae bacterium]|nr:hypothetical protein [Saprospiraceae bacterium]